MPTEKKPQVPFQVRATKLGYYDLKRRHPGAVFTVTGEQAFSSVWMEKVGGKVIDVPTGDEQPKGAKVIEENI